MGARRPADELLLFLHIPKAAGSSIHRVLRDQFPKHRTIKIDGRDVRATKARLVAMDADARAAVRCVRGHMAFGWHALFGDRPYSYFTMLREPVDRVVSDYYFVRRDTRHFLHDEVAKGEMSLRRYVESGISPGVNNGQTRMLSGDEELSQAPWGSSVSPFGSNDEALLERARHNLDQCEVVGTQAAFEQTLILLRRTYGFRPVGYSFRNRTPGRPAASTLDPETAAAIIERNQLDIRLYRHAERRLAADVERLGSLTWDRAVIRLGRTLRPIYSAVHAVRRIVERHGPRR